MPRTADRSSLDKDVETIVARASREIAVAVRQNIAAEIERVLGGSVGGSRLVAGGRQRRVILCPVQGCGKPGGGPKWGWFCIEHKSLPAAEKEKARAARGSAKPAKPGRKKK